MASKMTIPSQALLRSHPLLRPHRRQPFLYASTPLIYQRCLRTPRFLNPLLGKSSDDNGNPPSEEYAQEMTVSRMKAEQQRKLKKSFRSQLFESTADRVQRERERETWYSENKPTTMFWRNTAIMASTVLMTALGWVAGCIRPYEKDPNSTLKLEDVGWSEHNTSPHNLEAAWIDLCVLLGEENVTEREDDLYYHAKNEWINYNAKQHERPGLVCYPKTTEQVSAIMKMAHKRKLPVTGYSGGTSLEGQFTPTRGGICVDFRRMDKIVRLDREDMDVVVQPSVGWEDLNEELAKDGLFFPPDPGPGAQIGGMVGTGCSGTNAYRYGTMRDWVLSLTVVLADGTIMKTKQRPRKSSAGYDLTRTFIGSEGTLGLVTEATLRLTNKPKNERVAVTSFGSIREAAQLVSKVVSDGVPIQAVEILDDVQMKCINDSGSTSRHWKEAPTLFFKFAGTRTGVQESIDIVKNMAKKQGCKGFEFARSEDEAAELWSARKAALFSVLAKKRDENDHVWTTDVAVPISKLPDIIEQTKDDISSCGLLGTMVGHVGDGNFHGKTFQYIAVIGG